MILSLYRICVLTDYEMVKYISDRKAKLGAVRKL